MVKSSLYTALLLLGTASGAAKCPFDLYEIRGAIYTEDKRPVKDARILVFLDDAAKADAQDTTTSDGKFRLALRFDSFSHSSLFGDNCDRAPEQVEVVAWKSGFAGVRKHWKRKDIQIQDIAPAERLIELGSVRLERQR